MNMLKYHRNCLNLSALMICEDRASTRVFAVLCATPAHFVAAKVVKIRTEKQLLLTAAVDQF
jgi:hypothetical protein